MYGIGFFIFSLLSYSFKPDVDYIHIDESEYSPAKSSCPGIKQIHRVSNNRERRIGKPNYWAAPYLLETSLPKPIIPYN